MTWTDPYTPFEPLEVPTELPGYPLGQPGGRAMPFCDREYAHLKARQAQSPFRPGLRHRPHMPAALIRGKGKVMPATNSHIASLADTAAQTVDNRRF
jgi:hypothetical protein